MTISVDIDGVISNTSYYGEEEWENGGKEHFGHSLPMLKLRWKEWPEVLHRWLEKGDLVWLVSARAPEHQEVTRRWLQFNGISNKVGCWCCGDDKNEVLKGLGPDLHFDDNPNHDVVEGFRRVWHPSWGVNDFGGLETLEEIVEVVNAKKSADHEGSGECVGDKKGELEYADGQGLSATCD